MRAPISLTVLKPHIAGKWTRTGRNVKWHCVVRQRIGEMEVCVARSGWRYKPRLAYKAAMSALEDTAFADAAASMVAKNKPEAR